MRPATSVPPGPHRGLTSLHQIPCHSPAPTTSISERKVWVGSIPESVTEHDLRVTLGKYGFIVELYYKHGPMQASRGWAFVTYSSPEDARSLIQQVDGSTMFPNSDRPLEARFANSKETVKRDAGNGLTQASPLCNPVGSGNSMWVSMQPSQPAPPHGALLSQDPTCMPSVETRENATSIIIPPSSGGHVLSCPSAPTPGGKIILLKRPVDTPVSALAIPDHTESCPAPPAPVLPSSLEPLDGLSLWQIYYTADKLPYFYNSISKHVQWEYPIPPQEYVDVNGQPNMPKAPAMAAGRNYGPPGANLFIFHLPSGWTDGDLRQHFNCFGNVVSSRIQTDSTGRNSGFGFVSYDTPASAIAAIRLMNGFGVCGKFLKVQLKKGEEHLLPHDVVTEEVLQASR